MKNILTYLYLAFFGSIFILNAQESLEKSENYIEFNDRSNTVHGVYMGIGTHYGKINDADTYLASFKIAFVANQRFEIGVIGVGLYSDLNRKGLGFNDNDLTGVYGGFHVEPILFYKSKLNLSFPILIGGGAITLINEDEDNLVVDGGDWQAIAVFEPGISLLYNISKYIQLEAGIKHRFSSKVDLLPENEATRIDGFSVGFGIKVGLFNMGRNRYGKLMNNYKE